MIPSVLARHIEQGVKDFLRTTFPVTNLFFADLLERFLTEPGKLFKGPYLDIQLPFQPGKRRVDYFPDLPLPFIPYQHQEQSFARLTGPRPKPTIVATGTGSGKTECFLYPILQYCYQYRGEPGIKAILIYPMNALATDQAGRIARLMYHSKLRGQVTAGIYIGQQEKESSMAMQPEKLISDKHTLRLSPPDILLTNYKMLDYLLLRPDDRPLWEHNGPDNLRFLVVDELHTFDGAQGTDLGCLIRRLKARLAIEPGYLCSIGTSATLGGSDEHEELLSYAAAVFGEQFFRDAVITETRLSAGEFLGNSLVAQVDIVSPDLEADLDPANYADYEGYIRAQHQLWFGVDITGEFAAREWRVALCERLKEHLFFQNLLKILGGRTVSFDDIFHRLENVTRGLQNIDTDYRLKMLNSLLALVSEARIKVINAGEDGREQLEYRPFLNVRVQLWLRELRHMVGEVGGNPQLRFADDLNDEQLQRHLPLVHCRECGSMGWAGLKRKNDPVIMGDLQDFYQGFFRHDPKVVYLFPEEKGERETAVGDDLYYFCPHCLRVTKLAEPDRCPACDHPELILVYMPDTRVQRGKHQVSLNKCPYCDSAESLTLLGSRAASLTSVMIVQLFSSTFNNDKKLLTFSDNVQDAAHRAGFFNNRTFRFNFRTALQQVVLEKGDGLSLVQITETFVDFWSKRLDESTYIATFLAPNMDWLSDFEHLRRTGYLPSGSDLRRQVDRRVGWEIFSEYGFRTRIGRTLEKTGSSVVCLDGELLQPVVERLGEVLRNELGCFRDLDEKPLIQFLLGLLVHLKNRGGIMQPVLHQYVASFGSTYLLNRENWLPNFGPVSRAPVFLTTRKGSRFDQLFSSSSSRFTWYENWYEKNFRLLTPRLDMDVARDFYHLVLKTLVAEGVLEQELVKNDQVWGIRPEALLVSSRVRQLRCEHCGHNLSVATEESAFFEQAPCQRFHCAGRYKPLETGVDYYGKLYATGDVARIFAREHTGLLTRTEREDLEAEFKTEGDNRQPWFPNLLSCTPTLEMGIDIGSLSSLVLCSVPPAQSNYLQRIGRSGRRDGNALNLVVANARPHDLYFFAAPEEMLAGRVDSPGVFLDASAVLERQFTAFCFDRWVANEPDAFLPKRLGQVLNNLEPVDYRKFPHTFIHYIDLHQTDLLTRFFALFNYGAGLSEQSIEKLKIFVTGDRERVDSLRYCIMDGLHARRLERDSLRRKVQILNGKIKRKKQAPRDQNFERDLRELQIEKSALQALAKSIGDRNTYNFFTDEGLLPNYAFPEIGVMLNSLIYRRKSKVQEGEGSYETWNYEYERPAVSALAELAPENTFYAGGRRVKIDQVDMTVSEIETWRFCDNCSHKELLGKEEEKEYCPRCGSPMWSDEGQKQQMIRLRQVFASTADKRSRISDDSDDRDPVFYHKQMLVEFDDRQVVEAFKVDADFPFGFDFLAKVDFCEINFGEKSEIGERVAIAGEETPRQGFALCRVCGKVQGRNDQEPVHAFTCTARDKDSDKNLIDCFYLYRQFVSEAIRILLPVSIIAGSDRKLQSFIAAMQLGLKRKFRGKIDHLQTTVYEEPLADSSFKRKYLVLYDTVPGGTGYLKQLMRSEQLMEILELSLTALKACPCNQEEGKDGCYRCLFAYRNSYNMPETSRDTAIELLAEILEYRDRLVRTENLSNISMNTLIESELEGRFLEALRQYHTAELLVLLKKDVVNGKPGYFLKVGDRPYYIEPQVELGELAGVAIPSRADFIIRPARMQDAAKPVVVFLDGLSYHRARVGLDMAQRMAIVQSGKYHVWSLSWYDVQDTFTRQHDFYRDYLNPATLPAGDRFEKLLAGYGLRELKGLERQSSFAMLMRFLKRPEADTWRKFSFVWSLLHADANHFAGREAIENWRRGIKNIFPEEMAAKFITVDGDCLYGLSEPKDYHDQVEIEQFVLVEREAVRPPGETSGVRFGCCLDDRESRREEDGFRLVWNGYLRLFNLCQFLPHAYFVSREGLRQRVYDGLKLFDETAREATGTTTQPGREAWNEVKEMAAETLYGLLDTLSEQDWPLPEAGFELADSHGEIIASAELAWEELKIAFLRKDELDCQDTFELAGWRVYSLAAVLDNPAEYISLVHGLGG
jgi:DEAD/DEAH box helicase domain-containing protein